MAHRLGWLLLWLASLGLAGAVVVRHGTLAAKQPRLSAMARLGEKMFFDPGLSASGKESCASCHDPAHHFGPPNALAVQSGGENGRKTGIRAVPSLAYLDRTPAFTIGPPSLSDRDAVVAVPNSVVAGVKSQNSAAFGKAHRKAAGMPNDVPQGGLFWDGRVDTLEQQASGPLLSPYEMANKNAVLIVKKLSDSHYANDFRQLFGQDIFNFPERAMDEAGFALARFQIEDRRFHSYSSKYDAYLRGEVKLTPKEARGLALFRNPQKGNCAACHIADPTADGQPPLFTDHEYEALAVPRNRSIPANHDPHYFDLGLCGPLRHDRYAKQPANCGLFKTPSLRNVATRRVFFHNGVYSSLKQVLRFYALRETQPGKIYPKRADGSVARYDDLPRKYWANIDRLDAPFDRKPGDRPALTDKEMDDIIAFLGTLTDGYAPARTSSRKAATSVRLTSRSR